MRPVSMTGRRRWTATLAGLSLIAVTAACSPVTTTMTYAPSDGVRADVGSLTALNMLVIADDEGVRGNFIGAFSNPTSQPHDIVVELPEGSIVIDESIEGNGLANFNADNLLEITDLGGAKPGTYVVTVLRSGDQEVTVNVPVISGTEVDGVDTYHELAPAAAE